LYIHAGRGDGKCIPSHDPMAAPMPILTRLYCEPGAPYVIVGATGTKIYKELPYWRSRSNILPDDRILPPP
jgi:hypothetical protein